MNEEFVTKMRNYIYLKVNEINYEMMIKFNVNFLNME